MVRDFRSLASVAHARCRIWHYLFGTEGDPTDFEKVIARHYRADPKSAEAEIACILHWAAGTSNYWNPDRLKSSGAFLSAFETIQGQWTSYMEKVQEGAKDNQKYRRPQPANNLACSDGDHADELEAEDDEFSGFILPEDDELDA